MRQIAADCTRRRRFAIEPLRICQLAAACTRRIGFVIERPPRYAKSRQPALARLFRRAQAAAGWAIAAGYTMASLPMMDSEAARSSSLTLTATVAWPW